MNITNIKYNSLGIDLIRVQERLLYIGLKVRDIFEANNVKYMIAFGTLLGAVRHHDMIPWDDDFDMVLFQEDYERASDLLRKNLPPDLFLEDSKSEPSYFHAWSHVKDLKSICSNTLYPADDAYSHKGLHVDLYRIAKIKAGEVCEYLERENIAYINRRKTKGLIAPDDYERRKKISFSKYEVDDSIKDNEVYIFDGPYNQKTMKIKDVFPLKRYEIRGNAFYGPNNADFILKSIYGDYLKLPEEQNRKPKLDSVLFI